MKKYEAEKLVTDTFASSYDEGRFRIFISNLFSSSKFEACNDRPPVKDCFKGQVTSYKRLGKFDDAGGSRIDVLAVKLRDRKTLEKARTTQRNFVAWYLNNGWGSGHYKEAALVAFYVEDLDDWRFSLVRMDYILDEEKQKIQKELTPARRYSFLVGHNEGTHTARRQWLPVLQSSNEATLAELEGAFNIETVTKEFFEQYKSLYLRLKEALDQHIEADPFTREEFEKKGVETADFAKRLLGQLVFLYFLQRKGWLGVKKGEKWGTGPKDFLRKLFDRDFENYHNFFNDILEPLFYEALATERTDNFYKRFGCRIPFLNGGLFEPIHSYDWVNSDILLNDKIFEEIFDVFDLYNFTVREDEPLDKEVAVDPEMLGKVFENLIPENERKGSGTYYTPREIVHYMCQESLINYLDATLNIERRPTEAKGQQSLMADLENTDVRTEYEDIYTPLVPREYIEEFIRHGDGAQEYDAMVAEKKSRTSTYNKYRLPDSIHKHAAEMDEALAHVKVCDPAIGSGAFPVGVMSEIVRARMTLEQATLKKGLTPYQAKRHAIQSTIYGVDIEPSAVDIAKLRLWLSLVVDEEEFDGIQPLPNLEYKVMVGDSLVPKMSSDSFVYKGWLESLAELEKKFFDEYSPNKKKEIRGQIDELLEKLFQGYDNDYRFNYWIQFHDVLEKGGFDILIANPPYVSIEKFSGTKQQKRWKQTFDVFAARGDIYCLFYEQGFHLLKRNGSLCFITSNKFFRAAYGKKMREFFTTQVTLSKIIDFRHLPVFDATAYPAIISALNKKTNNDPILKTITFQEIGDIHNISHALEQYAVESKVSEMPVDGWVLAEGATKNVLQKIKVTGTPLKSYVNKKLYRGLITGLNEAFVIDDSTRRFLINQNPNSSELIHPWIRGKDIKRWHYQESQLFSIVIPFGFGEKVRQYPAIFEYLKLFEGKLRKRGQCEGTTERPGTKQHHWMELDNNPTDQFILNFRQPKIIWGNLATAPKFTYDETGTLVSAPANIIATNDLSLLGILNSPVCRWLISLDAAERSGGYLEFKPMYVGKIPIPDVSDEVREKMSALVRRVLDTKKQDPESDVSTLETKINSLVYKSYSLTPEEIAIIEASIK